MNKLLAILATAAALCVSATTLQAQQDNGGGGGGGRNRGFGGGGNFDPAQFRQMMMDNIKDNLGFTNDSDWSAVEPLVQKIVDARQEMGGRGGFGRRQRNNNNQDDNGGQRRNFNRPPNPDADALQQAIESNAPTPQIKAALAKYRASQKAKQDKLAQAQADLQKVLTPKQEAEAVLLGLLS